MYKLNKEGVRFSKRDKEKGIKLPTHLTEKLAEDIGVHIGDGSLYLCNPKRNSFEFSHASNTDEREYTEHIIKLKKELYNLTKYRINTKNKGENVRFSSLAIATFYINSLGIPAGSKLYTSKIPSLIKNSKDKKIMQACIRGIVDTDFYFCYKNKYGKHYPILTGNFASKHLVEDLEYLFNFIGIKTNTRFYTAKPDKRFNKSWISHIITISGHKEVGKYIQQIGFNNPKNRKRIRVSPRGFEPPTFHRNI
jgi:hypothetical protein